MIKAKYAEYEARNGKLGGAGGIRRDGRRFAGPLRTGLGADERWSGFLML